MITRLLIFAVFTLPFFAEAQIVITEVMYDLSEGSDSGREWIEVYNESAAPIDLTTWKIIESGKNHKITATNGALLQPGAYAAVADNTLKFKGDWASYPGLLFDSAFSLNNDGESLQLANSAGEAGETVSYTNTEANGTGDSLQRNSAGEKFMAGLPTPGAAIPAAGLIKSTPKPKASKKSTQKETSVGATSLSEVSGQVQAQALLASASLPPTPAFMWWLAPFLLASVSTGGMLLTRHYKKSEWDIVEEIEETS